MFVLLLSRRKKKQYIQSKSQTYIDFNVADNIVRTPEKVEPIMNFLNIIGKMHYYCRINNAKPKLQYFKKLLKTSKASNNIVLLSKNKQEKKHTEKWYVMQNDVQNILFE